MKSFPRSERIALTTLFFSFGFFVMALAPRFPDLKANLGVTYGTFGTLVGVGTLGAFTALMTMGHIIHKVGTFPVLFGSTVSMIGMFVIVANTTSSLVFLVANVFFGMSWASYHISVNTQSIHRQKQYGSNVIPFLHGMWTTGAVMTAIVAAMIADFVDFKLHMNIVALISALVMLTTIWRMRPLCIPASDVHDEDGAIGFVEMIKSFRIDWTLSAAYLSILAVEVTVGDWGALFSRDVLGVSKGNAIFPYIVFMSAMIVGRVGFSRVMKGRDEVKVVRAFIFNGAILFTFFILLTPLVMEYSKDLAFILLMLGLVAGGLGSSFLGPYLFGYAAKRSPRPDSVALAELSATNTALTFLYKLAIAWIAEVAGLTAALLIPGILFFLVGFYIKKILVESTKPAA
ncbi:MAG: MFS transporter [Candidatus Nanopelagicaceae bacterium]